MGKNHLYLSLSITGLNIFARVFHLLVFLLIGNIYGVGKTTDLVFLIYAPLSVIMSVIAGAAQVVIMPGVHRAEVDDCVAGFLHAIFKRALSFTAVTTALVILVVITVDTNIASNYQIVALLAPIPMLSCVSAFYTNVLNAHDKFRLAVLGPVFGAIGAILAIGLLPYSPLSLAFTLMVFEGSAAWGLWFVTRHLAVQQGEVNYDKVKKVMQWAMRGARMQVAGSLLAALNPMINIFFAKSLEPGSVTLIEYANRLWSMVPLLFSGSLMVYFSQRSKEESRQINDLGATHKVARNLGLVALVLSVAMIGGSSVIVDAMYGWGRMPPEDRLALSRLLSLYLIGSSVYIAGLVYVRAISASGKVYILTLGALFGVFLNILFNIVFIRQFGVYGIGMAMSVTNIIVSIFLLNRYIYSQPLYSRHEG